MAKILFIHYKGRERSAVFEAIHFLQTSASNLQKLLDEISHGKGIRKADTNLSVFLQHLDSKFPVNS